MELIRPLVTGVVGGVVCSLLLSCSGDRRDEVDSDTRSEVEEDVEADVVIDAGLDTEAEVAVEVDADTDTGVSTAGDAVASEVAEDGDAEAEPDGRGCTASAQCDDDNVCTTDVCVSPGECVHIPLAGACDDHDLCTLDDHCDGGRCVGADAIDCDDDNRCTVDLCELGVGCLHLPQPGTACNDRDACTPAGICDTGGACEVGAPIDCDDHDACTADSCDPMLGCQNVRDECNDSNPCTLDTCIGADVCIHTNGGYNRPGETCEDGNACTFNYCWFGQCALDVRTCDDGEDETVDTCEPGRGCVFSPIGAEPDADAGGDAGADSDDDDGGAADDEVTEPTDTSSADVTSYTGPGESCDNPQIVNLDYALPFITSFDLCDYSVPSGTTIDCAQPTLPNGCSTCASGPSPVLELVSSVPRIVRVTSHKPPIVFAGPTCASADRCVAIEAGRFVVPAGVPYFVIFGPDGECHTRSISIRADWCIGDACDAPPGTPPAPAPACGPKSGDATRLVGIGGGGGPLAVAKATILSGVDNDWRWWSNDDAKWLASSDDFPGAHLTTVAGSTLLLTTPDAFRLVAANGSVTTIARPDVGWNEPHPLVAGLSSDGSYVWTASKWLKAWTLAGTPMFTRVNTHYQTAAIFASPTRLQVALGPLGDHVIQTFDLETLDSEVSDDFAGTFLRWSSEGNHFLTNDAGLIRVYRSDAIEARPPVALGPAAIIQAGTIWSPPFGPLYLISPPTGPIPFSMAGLLVGTSNTDAMYDEGAEVAVVHFAIFGYPPIFRFARPEGLGHVSAFATDTSTFGALAGSDPATGGLFRTNSVERIDCGLLAGIANSSVGRSVVATSTTLMAYDLGPEDTQIVGSVSRDASAPRTFRRVAITLDGSIAAAQSDDGRLTAYELPGLTPIGEWADGPGLIDWALAQDGPRVARFVCDGDGSCRRIVTDVSGLETIYSDVVPAGPFGLVMSPSGTLVAVSEGAGVDAQTRIHQDGAPLATIVGTALAWVDEDHLIVRVTRTDENDNLVESDVTFDPLGNEVPAVEAPPITYGDVLEKRGSWVARTWKPAAPEDGP